jgi:hypothetical protein
MEQALAQTDVADREPEHGPDESFVALERPLAATLPVVIAEIGRETGGCRLRQPEKNGQEDESGQRQGDGSFHGNLLSPLLKQIPCQHGSCAQFAAPEFFPGEMRAGCRFEILFFRAAVNG